MEIAKPKVAFLGATGGCTCYCLTLCLKDGLQCTALARTPSKLVDALKAKGVTQSAIDANLNIVKGDVRDVEALKKVLANNVDIIVSGIGAYPKMHMSLTRPIVATDPSICADAAATTLEAASAVYAGSDKKPLLVNISTTGIQPADKPSDVPVLLAPLYHWLLKEPHHDKRMMEQRVEAHTQLPDSEKGIRGFVTVKPTLLADGDGKGINAVKEGTADKPAKGYMIQRGDVGRWIYERIIKTNGSSEQQKWTNKAACLTN